MKIILSFIYVNEESKILEFSPSALQVCVCFWCAMAFGFGKRFGRLADCHFDPFGRSQVSVVTTNPHGSRTPNAIPPFASSETSRNELKVTQRALTWHCQPKVGNQMAAKVSASVCCLHTFQRQCQCPAFMCDYIMGDQEFIGLRYFIEWLVINISAGHTAYAHFPHICLWLARNVAPGSRKWTRLSQEPAASSQQGRRPKINIL